MSNAIGTLISLILLAGILFLFDTTWWRIFSKAGRSRAMGLLMFIPLVNFIMLLVLTFGEWPVHKELRELRRQTP